MSVASVAVVLTEIDYVLSRGKSIRARTVGSWLCRILKTIEAWPEQSGIDHLHSAAQKLADLLDRRSDVRIACLSHARDEIKEYLRIKSDRCASSGSESELPYESLARECVDLATELDAQDDEYWAAVHIIRNVIEIYLERAGINTEVKP